MKFKALLFVCCFSLFTSVFAANQHVHPQANNADNKPANKGMTWPGYCEIEIINNSYSDVRVNGVFDDGTTLIPFNVYSFESPHYISLYYYGYCHAGMDVYIDTLSGYNVYAAYTPRNSTIRIVPYLTNQVKAEVKAK